jgi:hypothetical protein
LGATMSPVDKTTRQDLIVRLISERDLGTQQDVVGALADEGVEVAQATVSRDLTTPDPQVSRSSLASSSASCQRRTRSSFIPATVPQARSPASSIG